MNTNNMMNNYNWKNNNNMMSITKWHT
jgi:hypothetical protein